MGSFFQKSDQPEISMLRGRTAVMLAAALVVALTAPQAWALSGSKGQAGLNHARAHTAPHSATGSNVNVVIVDDPVNPANVDLGARLKGTLNFSGRTPETAGAPPAGLVGNATTHAERTADIIGSSDATDTGVANAANIFAAQVSGQATLAELQSVFDYYHSQANLSATGSNANIFNLSLPIPAASSANDNGANSTAKFVDWFIRTRDIIVVKSAGNSGTTTSQISKPGDAFNLITVGATDAAFTARADYSDYWLSSDNGTSEDWRGKPDILAPGSGIGTRNHPDGAGDTGTSFAAPHVAGIAALLAEKGLTGETAGRDHLAQKAIILNSARKRFINIPENGFTTAMDHAGTGGQPSDGDYLNGGVLRANSSSSAAPKTRNWSPSLWSSDAQGKVLQVLRPLDDEQGTGLADAERALIQFDGGEQEENQSVTPIGWNRDAMTADNTPHDYSLDIVIPTGTFITATLTWDRIINEQETGGGAGDNIVESTDNYVDGSPFLPDFDLQILYLGDVVAESIGIGGSLQGQNVEHLHYPVFEAGETNDYSIRVDLKGIGGDFYDYGVAWWTVPEPSTLLVASAGALFLLRRRERVA